MRKEGVDKRYLMVLMLVGVRARPDRQFGGVGQARQCHCDFDGGYCTMGDK